ncbi:hypothetical protein LB467_16735 [Salegentibacter sp. JZCK2]|uniref:hypothetical protein n=1 Tax=Salegentibacter tibetensis TaxID=2873600 RepID=UPI001CCEE5CE|nr:hypothetical protein [Salegentibacter tibetensis]MBZ9731337.1 hypothetical protein [Salegentibacter tibetensis]
MSSCKVVDFGGNSLKPLASQPLPGTIGVLQSAEFIEAGVPKLEEKIRLSFQKKLYKKRSLRKHNKKELQKDQRLKIIDSLDLRPYYYKIEIADKIGLIATLNESENKNLKTFLEATQRNVIITSMEIYFPSEVAGLIDQASEIYLVNNKTSSYSLELLNKDRSRNIIDFNEGTSFGYGFSAFCWRENNRRQPEIAAFRKKGRSCPGVTETNPEKLKSEDIFEKL